MPQAQPVQSNDDASSPLAEDALRAQAYRLLARYLSAPPSDADLRAGAQLAGDDSPFGRAIGAFASVCARYDAPRAAEEYQQLFIGLVRGELVPYGSYYLTGFLHEKPLAKLRQDMAALGIARDPSVHDPEDHIASLCEMMAGLIDGALGPPLPPREQQRFYAAHVGSWAHVFFRDLHNAKSSALYAALGAVGRAFLEIEERAFAMA